MVKSNQRSKWTEVLTSPGGLLGYPGDWAYARSTGILWVKERGFGTPLGWRPVGGDSSESSVFTPQQFGAQGGSADDTEAIQSALDAAGAAGGGEVLFNQIFRASETLTVPDGVDLVGVGENGGISFEGEPDSNFPSGAAILAEGDLSALPAISSALTAGDTSITFAAAHGLSVGDIVVFTDTTLFNPARPYYNAGEYVRVESVPSATEINLAQPLFGTYATPGDLSAYRLEGHEVGLSNLRIVGPGTSSVTVVRLSMCVNVNIRDLNITGSQRALVEFDRCYSCQAVGLRALDFGPSLGLNYAIAILNSQKIEVGRCEMATTRHAITIGGAAAVANAVNREIRVYECQLSGGIASTSCDCHGNTEFCTYEHNNIRGMSMGGQNHTIHGNQIYASDTGIAILFIEVRSPSFDIVDNDIIETADVTTTSISGLLKWSESPSDILEGGTLRVRNNRMDMKGFSGRVGVFRNFSTTVLTCKAEVSGNFMRRDDASEPFCFFSFDGGGGGGGWELVRFVDNTMLSLCPRVAATQAFECIANTILDSGANGIEYAVEATNPYTLTRVRCIDNTVIAAQLNGIRLAADAALTTHAIVSGNTSLNNRQGGGSPSATASLYSTNFDTVLMRQNVMGDDQAVPTQQRIWRVDNCVYLDAGDNSEVGAIAIKAIQVSVTQRVTRTIGINQDRTTRESQGTAAPTTGTWSQGDIVWNIDATVGQPQGWRCTVSGTPGTWVAMPVL